MISFNRTSAHRGCTIPATIRVIAELSLCASLIVSSLVEIGVTRALMSNAPVTGAALTDGPLAVHQSSSFATSVTNIGIIGTGFSRFAGQAGAPSFEFPPDSDVEYLFGGSIWIGGIVNGDTLVTVGADGWQLSQEFSASPEHPDVELVAGPADVSFSAIYTDTFVDPFSINPFDGLHRPLNLRVTQTSRHWTDQPFDDFLIVEYLIENLESDTIQQMWFGLYLDADVLHTGDGPAGFTDDYTGFISDHDIAWAADNDGHSDIGEVSWDSTSQRGAIGAKFIDFDPPSPNRVNYNWWLSNGAAALDWGPRLAGTASDPFRDFGGFLGTPEGDRNKHYILSHNERDYDKIETALDHTADGWLPPLTPGVVGLADGMDTRFLISKGGIDLAPGETLKVVIALVAGYDLHRDPSAFFNLFDPFEPQLFTNTLDFSDLINNMQAAESLYQSGYNTPVFTPPPPVQVNFSANEAPTISWLFSDNVNVTGYDVYLKRIPETLLWCGIAPVDTPSLAEGDRITIDPVTVDSFTLTGLVDGSLYAVGVAIRPPPGQAPRISEAAVFTHGVPVRVALDDQFRGAGQRRERFLTQSGQIHLSWSDPNGDAAFYHIYRFSDANTNRFTPGRVEFFQGPCPPADLICDSLADVSSNTHLCAFRPIPYLVIPAPATEFIEQVSGPSKFHYQVSVIDTIGNESDATDPLTIYARPSRLKKVAAFLGDSLGTLWFTRWDSVLTYYQRALASYQPEFIFRRNNGSLRELPDFTRLGEFEYLIIDGAG
ncbi:MAG: hypothetical protein ACE5GA_04940, partial [Candidatus Zixiibacteriota bacterium]